MTILDADDWCYSHNRPEPVVPGCVRCGECLHVFPTPEDLVDDDNALREDLQWPPNDGNPNLIVVCPHCGHDL